MSTSKLFITLAIGLSAAACQSPVPQQSAMAPMPLTNSQQACLDYGFTAGTPAYSGCVQREHDARMRGRVSSGYADSQLVADARDACTSYGLQPATGPYDRCVSREVSERRYQNGTAVVYTPAPPPPAYYPTPVYAPAPPAPQAGVPAFKDEFGFRYDGQGNRLDRNGNIISPQSTQP